MQESFIVIKVRKRNLTSDKNTNLKNRLKPQKREGWFHWMLKTKSKINIFGLQYKGNWNLEIVSGGEADQLCQLTWQMIIIWDDLKKKKENADQFLY